MDNGKVWEIRGEPCRFRGRFAIAASGTSSVVGEATMVDCLRVGKIDKETGKLMPYRRTKAYKKVFLGREEHFKKHRIADLSIVKYPTVYAWKLDDAVRYKKPQEIFIPQGCIKWVNIGEGVEAEVSEEEKADAESSDSDVDDGGQASKTAGAEVVAEANADEPL